MAEDEVKAFQRLQTYGIEFVEPAIAARGGIFKLIGDEPLAEFAYVVVECAYCGLLLGVPRALRLVRRDSRSLPA
jgi:hypothetical protein